MMKSEIMFSNAQTSVSSPHPTRKPVLYADENEDLNISSLHVDSTTVTREEDTTASFLKTVSTSYNKDSGDNNSSRMHNYTKKNSQDPWCSEDPKIHTPRFTTITRNRGSCQ